MTRIEKGTDLRWKVCQEDKRNVRNASNDVIAECCEESVAAYIVNLANAALRAKDRKRKPRGQAKGEL